MRLSLFSLLILLAVTAAPAEVRIWQEPMTVPTYVTGPPDPNPMFYLGRTYQGARGAIYPYPLYDKLTDRKEDRSYTAVWLENEYVKICVLPELGGRIFAAVDKTNGYDFFYRQHVVKPALIGMLGAWISGGVEWNIPHHHRASSFLPVQYKLTENADGSKTVWVGELEIRHRMRWAVGLTLAPGRSYVKADVRLVNRSPLANSMLYFANVAVHTNEKYQILFPPRTQFVTQHSKREFSRWPIADGMYAGVDFSKGVDVSRWKNHPSPISMFAWNYEDDFVAGYDHGKQAGTMHVADHHIVPGKKFFAWGTGPDGRLWDKILTDEDGPYLELMVGAYSDNQPDYSWMQPFETRRFEQYWYPFRDIGGVKNANRDAAVNLERTAPGKAKVGFSVTGAVKEATVLLSAAGRELLRETVSIDPGKPFVREVDVPAEVKDSDLRAALLAGRREVIAYTPLQSERLPMPPPATAPPPPKQVKSNEELYLAGLRLEQFHSPASDPDPYYEEALRRDPSDARANTALGILDLKRGRFAEAAKRLATAAARVSQNYTYARDVEPFYYLGLALKMQNKLDEAFDAYFKATWGQAFSSAAYFGLAEIASMRGERQQALAFLARSLETNALNTRALALRAALSKDAKEPRERLLAIDPLDTRDPDTLKRHPHYGLEVAVELGNAGLYEEALATLALLPKQPMIHYFAGLYHQKLGRAERAAEEFAIARTLPHDYVFPYRSEAIEALTRAMTVDPKDARAPYLLGNLLYDWQPGAAAKLWERAAALEPGLPIVHRNLAVAYGREEDGLKKAIASLEKAVDLGGKDAMHLFELDQLYERAGVPAEKRLAAFERHAAAVAERDDTTARSVSMRVQMGQYDRAIEQLKNRHYHGWEGGARFNVYDAWIDAHLLRGHARRAKGDWAGALADYEAANTYPENLEISRRYRGGRAPEVLYWIGEARRGVKNEGGAKAAWKEAAAQLIGDDEAPHPTVSSGAALYWQARSLERLGDVKKAAAAYQALVEVGSTALKDTRVDYFAKFGERQSKTARDAEAQYVLGLGQLGMKRPAQAQAAFAAAVKLNGYHLAARTILESVK
ncbi:MAG TPA: DUF5107 domain-containing protein [Solibacterales bacterium]|nr:DUF5107 domain-containing protein [Bryobacterales bacterium]